MKNKILSWILIFSLALNLAVVGTFIFKKMNYDRSFSSSRDKRDFLPFQKMGLDDEQRDTMFQMMHDFRSSTHGYKREINQLEKEMFNAIHSSELDSFKINLFMEQIAELRLQQSKKAISYFHKFKKVLTKDQQKHFFQMMMEHRSGGMSDFRRNKMNKRPLRKFPGNPDTLK